MGSATTSSSDEGGRGDGIEIVSKGDLGGEDYSEEGKGKGREKRKFSTMVRRDELFNRLASLDIEARWESL